MTPASVRQIERLAAHKAESIPGTRLSAQRLPASSRAGLWMLVLTGSTINVESMMGAIMAVCVGVANGNLLITFANDLREEGRDAVAAAIEAGRTRFRPILMTALAMILVANSRPPITAWGCRWRPRFLSAGT